MFYQDYRNLLLIVFLIVMIAIYLIYTNSFRLDRMLNTSTTSPVYVQKGEYSEQPELVPIQQNLLFIDFDRDDYYVFDPRICPDSGQNITVMILVITAPENKIKRGYIRKTWGHYGTRSDIGFGFVIGKVINEMWEKDLQDENMLYNDIIRVDFFDSYNNLTLKSVSSLNWLDRFCNQTKFYLKSDDDVFINVPRLLEFIETKKLVPRTIFGHLAVNWQPFRDPRSKYYLSETDYAPNVFMPFTTGPVYLMTIDCVHDLFMSSLVTRPLKLEDVFITGILASGLNITRLDVTEFTNDNKISKSVNYTVHNTITKHDIAPSVKFDMWKFLEIN